VNWLIELTRRNERPLFPFERSFERLRPSASAMGYFIRGFLGLERAIFLPGLLDLSTIFPKTGCQASQVSRSEGSGFDDLRSADWDAENVRLELHEQIVARGPPIDAQFVYGNARIFFHDFEDIGHLESDSLQRGARNVSCGGPARQTGNRATRILIPVRRPQPGKRGYQVNPAAICDAACERFHIDGGFDQSQSISQPLNHCATDEHAAFQSVVGASVGLPGHGGEKLVLRWRGLRAEVHQNETAGAISVFGQAARKTVLSEERGLLIA